MLNSKSKQRGFTIVELLIVIVVIAILAAISIVAFNGIQGRANDTAVQSDLANFSKKAAIFHADNGRYPGTGPELLTLETRPSRSAYATTTVGQNNFFYCTSITTNDIYILGAKANSGNNYYVSSSGRGSSTGAYNSSTNCGVIGLTAGTNTWTTNGYTQSSGQWNAAWIQ